MASAGRVREAWAKYVHADFRHHDVCFRGDRDSFLAAMEENAQTYSDKNHETLRALEHGDVVAIHGRVAFGGSRRSVIHIFRCRENRIVGKWVASREAWGGSPNENGIF